MQSHWHATVHFKTLPKALQASFHSECFTSDCPHLHLEHNDDSSRSTQKNPEQIKHSVASHKVSYSTTGKRLGKNWLNGGGQRYQPLQTNKNTKTYSTPRLTKHFDTYRDALKIYLKDSQDKCGTFWKVCPITSKVKLIQHFRKLASYHQSNIVIVRLFCFFNSWIKIWESLIVKSWTKICFKLCDIVFNHS